jgi:hypothetical protein
LPGGDVLTVRSVTPADVDGLVALYDGLSEDDRYRRFFSGFRPPRSFFERLVNVGERGGYGLVATAGSDGDVVAGARIVGEASYELLPNGDGELAITVAADQRGWIGPYLLDALVEAAAARGVPNLEADVLATNGPHVDAPAVPGGRSDGSQRLDHRAARRRDRRANPGLAHRERRDRPQ